MSLDFVAMAGLFLGLLSSLPTHADDTASRLALSNCVAQHFTSDDSAVIFKMLLIIIADAQPATDDFHVMLAGKRDSTLTATAALITRLGEKDCKPEIQALNGTKGAGLGVLIMEMFKAGGKAFNGPVLQRSGQVFAADLVKKLDSNVYADLAGGGPPPAPASGVDGGALDARHVHTAIRLDPEHPLRVGADYYPAASRLAHEEGLCRVRVNVDATGSITESAIDTSSGYPRLDEACLNAVVGQHVLPATEDGRPVPATAILPINWKLAGPTAELPGSAPANEDRSANNLIERGAIAGTAQRVFFLYSVNGDCSSAGLAQVAVDKAPEHGKVSFAKISDYTDFPASNKNYACNHKGKVNGLAVVYTPSKDFSGKERFSVQGVWPKGGLFNFDFSIKVLQAQP